MNSQQKRILILAAVGAAYLIWRQRRMVDAADPAVVSNYGPYAAGYRLPITGDDGYAGAGFGGTGGGGF